MSISDIAQLLGIHERWLPPLDHAEMIAGAIEHGSCHIQHRGHGVAPLLVFDDGGAMELSRVRWMHTDRGERLVSVGEEHSPDQTTHYDVCGTVDSIESIVGRSEAAIEEGDRQKIEGYLDDIEHMIARMKGRRDEYEHFVSEVSSLLTRRVRRKEVAPAPEWIKALHGLIQVNDPKAGDAETPDESWNGEFVDTIERVRDVAQYLEYCLADYKQIAIELQELIDQVRGGRSWSKR